MSLILSRLEAVEKGERDGQGRRGRNCRAGQHQHPASGGGVPELTGA
jgi:hypothetical protein